VGNGEAKNPDETSVWLSSWAWKGEQEGIDDWPRGARNTRQDFSGAAVFHAKKVWGLCGRLGYTRRYLATGTAQKRVAATVEYHKGREKKGKRRKNLVIGVPGVGKIEGLQCQQSCSGTTREKAFKVNKIIGETQAEAGGGLKDSQ